MNYELNLSHACGDDSHFVDFIGVAASGEVVDRRIQTLEDRTVSLIAAQSLCDLVADVACLDKWEDECVSLTCYLAVRALGLCNFCGNCRIELELAVDNKLGIELSAHRALDAVACLGAGLQEALLPGSDREAPFLIKKAP